MDRSDNEDGPDAPSRACVWRDHKCPRIPPVLYAGMLAVGSAIATVALLRIGAALF